MGRKVLIVPTAEVRKTQKRGAAFTTQRCKNQYSTPEKKRSCKEITELSPEGEATNASRKRVGSGFFQRKLTRRQGWKTDLGKKNGGKTPRKASGPQGGK